MASPSTTSLETEFAPDGSHQEWWPRAAMRSITPYPTQWVKIAELTPGPATDERRCALIPINDVPDELARERSRTSDIGQVEIFDRRGFHDGLFDPFDGRVEFFCQVRWLATVAEPSVEWALPFLWYWRAVRRGDSWVYLDSAGRDTELARVRAAGKDDYCVEVHAMALRNYLHVRRMAMLLAVQIDQDHPEASSVTTDEHAMRCDWASMEFQTYEYEGSRVGGRLTAASSLHGQYVILPAAGASGPAWCSNQEPSDYPAFIYGTDASSGGPLTVEPTPANVGTDGSPGPHFWTRVYFRQQVLDRYLAEPGRYTITTSRITCLQVWGMSIGRTTDGLVEVDLYDLSRMPSPEWDHWKTHNVPPSGGDPDAGKLQRERLNRIASSPDTAHELRSAVERANEAARQHQGWPLWRPLTEPAATEWQALHAPVVDDMSALGRPLLTLSKVLVDSLDKIQLQAAVAAPADTQTGSLNLLQLYLVERGGTAGTVQPLRDLQRLRSRGGFAHYAGSAAELEIATIAPGLRTPAEIFEYLCHNIIQALASIAETVSASREVGP